jgi:hypothetical protein
LVDFIILGISVRSSNVIYASTISAMSYSLMILEDLSIYFYLGDSPAISSI